MEPTKGASFARLQEEHEKALQNSKERIRKWEHFRADYEALQARLHTLPERITHDIMVPFGRFAFMAGQLYHTNEIMVLLGDNWFAKRSAKQAIEMVERRKQYLTQMLEDERKQVSDWEARLGFVADFRSSILEHEGTVEIREEYDPEVETRKRSERRARAGAVPPPRRVKPVRGMTKGTQGEGSEEGRKKEERKLWERLDELEREEEEYLKQEQEDEEGEEEAEGTEIVSKEQTRDGLGVDPPASGSTQRPVRVQNGRHDTSSGTGSSPSVPAHRTSGTWKDSKAGHADEGGGGGKVEAGSGSPSPLRITVTHTEAKPDRGTPEEDEDPNLKPLFKTPADIFRHFSKPVSSDNEGGERERESHDARAAVKTVSWDPNLVTPSGGEGRGDAVIPAPVQVGPVHLRVPTLPRQEPTAAAAFSGSVVERHAPVDQTQVPDPSRKVSRFKASRLTKQ